MKTINEYLVKPINEKLKKININSKNKFNIESLSEYITNECGFLNLDEGVFTREYVLGSDEWSFEEIVNKDSKENEFLLNKCETLYNEIKEFKDWSNIKYFKEKIHEYNCKVVYSKGTKGPDFNSLAFIFVYRENDGDDPVLYAIKISTKNLMTFKCIKK